jgi:hypothetical protein
VPDGPGTRRWPGSEVVVKTALGLATGGFTFYLSRLIDQSDAWSIILSVLMGGVVLIVGFLTSFERRLGSMEASLPAHNTEVVSVVGRRLGEIGRAVDLVERSSRSTELLSLLDETLAFLEAEAAGGPALPRSFVLETISQQTALIRDLRGGTAIYRGEDRDWLLALTLRTTSTLDAVSTAGGITDRGIDSGFWDSDHGRRYLQYQRDAVARGIRVRRVFVLDQLAYDDQQVLDGIRGQRRFGIDVRRILDSACESEPEVRDSVLDFVLFDDAISYQLSNATLRGIARTTLLRNPQPIAENRRTFDWLWANADDPGAARPDAPGGA